MDHKRNQTIRNEVSFVIFNFFFFVWKILIFNFISLKLGESVCSTFKKTNAHSGVRKLQFSGNPVSEWHEICRLGRVFPNLQSLVLAECPLKYVLICL